VQKEIHDNLHNLNIIPKSRQLGCTTFVSILFLDQILFSKNKTAGIICHRIEDVRKIFRYKIRFAWDNLHPWLKDKIGEPTTETTNELTFPNGGTIFTSMTTRSQTLQFLHISEFAYICQKEPDKAEEIVTGALNSVSPDQLVIIESTARGASGYFYDFVQEAAKMQKEERKLSTLDWKLHFFPWWIEPTYVLDTGGITVDMEKKMYFQSLKERHGISLTAEQKAWYLKKAKTMGNKMKEEFPSFLDECFERQIEGAYYATQMDKVYRDRRVRNVPYDASLEVHTFWDLGMNDTNVILFVQAYGPEIRFIDMYENTGEGLSHYVNVLREKPYTYGVHVLPHDVRVRNLDEHGKSRMQTLMDLGLTNIRVVEKTKDVNDDIEAVRKLFSRFYIDETNCLRLVEALNNYSKEWDKKQGRYQDRPAKKWSHIADPLRSLARYWDQMFDSTLSDYRNSQEPAIASFF
jgi:hypothetical protein